MLVSLERPTPLREGKYKRQKPSRERRFMLLQDRDLPTEHCRALLGAHNASHFVWNWSDADNPSHASVGTVQQLNQCVGGGGLRKAPVSWYRLFGEPRDAMWTFIFPWPHRWQHGSFFYGIHIWIFLQSHWQTFPLLPHDMHPVIHTKIRAHLEKALINSSEQGWWERNKYDIYWNFEFHTYSFLTTNIFMQSFWGGA